MKKRIAVCISGQLRTVSTAAKFLMPFFDSAEYDVDYFYHTWSTNTWTHHGHVAPPSEVNPNELSKAFELFQPKKHKTDKLGCFYDFDYVTSNNVFASLFYSMMMANHLKRQYEIENNFVYDAVFKTRFDVAFRPGMKFNLSELKPRTLFTSNISHFEFEFFRPNFADINFFGDSKTMDLACDYFRIVSRVTNDDISLIRTGVGVGFYKYLVDKNIYPKQSQQIAIECIVRKAAEEIENISFEQLRQIHQDYYRIFMDKAK